MKTYISFLLTALFFCIGARAQKIDFDNWTSDSRYTETGYDGWTVNKGISETNAFANTDGDTITVTVDCGDSDVENRCVRANWWKDGCNNYSALTSDCVAVYGYDSDGNTPQLTSESATMNITISGLAGGTHSLLIYMNVTDGSITSVAPIDISVDGTTVLTDVEMSSRATTASAGGQVYINFEVTEGEDVVVSLTSVPEDGITYGTSGVFVNALVFDRPNPKTTALDPYPENEDMHVDADDGTLTMTWTAATSAVTHHVYIGTSESDMTLVLSTSDAEYAASGLSTHNTYYWRVDEEDADGNVYEGEVWTFRPRRLAFPGAEGYGRYAIGGRGGSVYHVTSLDDDPDDPQPGTFRYGAKSLTGPRTIVFDVSGIIYLKDRLSIGDSCITIAGQTAPGKGILFRGAPIGAGGSDAVVRFVRMLRGYHNDDEDDINRGLDGLGLAGANHSIMDHCSVGWTIDEAFSSRNCKNITLQRTLISEALNIANHPNYSSGTAHGYAATIGGDTGSYHHNLLVHNSGRNWSMSGGLDGSGAYAGYHDMFNNVCYNWRSRTTDGGTHEGQFVNNYYKMGPASTKKLLITADLEGTGTGTQSYYVSGNIRENTDGTKTTDAYEDTYNYTVSNGQVLDWDVFVDEPFFESYATIETAELAYKTVLSDAGANQPVLDDHDTRIFEETLAGTYTYVGSVSGYYGIIDRETDAGGYEDYPEEARADDFDTDQDGMPDWWEYVKGLNVDYADNNSDDDGDGYTALEEYLNWLAEPHYTLYAGTKTEIDLAELFRGFTNDPYYSCDADIDGIDISIDDNILSVTPASGTYTLLTLPVVAGDNDNIGEMTRNINLYVSADATGIDRARLSIGDDDATTWKVYTVNGVLVSDDKPTGALTPGVYVVRAVNNGKTMTFKTVVK